MQFIVSFDVFGLKGHFVVLEVVCGFYEEIQTENFYYYNINLVMIETFSIN